MPPVARQDRLRGVGRGDARHGRDRRRHARVDAHGGPVGLPVPGAHDQVGLDQAGKARVESVLERGDVDLDPHNEGERQDDGAHGVGGAGRRALQLPGRQPQGRPGGGCGAQQPSCQRRHQRPDEHRHPGDEEEHGAGGQCEVGGRRMHPVRGDSGPHRDQHQPDGEGAPPSDAGGLLEGGPRAPRIASRMRARPSPPSTPTREPAAPSRAPSETSSQKVWRRSAPTARRMAASPARSTEAIDIVL